MCWSLPTLTVPAAHVPRHGACSHPSSAGTCVAGKDHARRQVPPYHSKQIDALNTTPARAFRPPPPTFSSITCSPSCSQPKLLVPLDLLSSSCVRLFWASLYSLVWPVRIPSSCSRRNLNPSLPLLSTTPRAIFAPSTHSPQRKADSILGIHQTPSNLFETVPRRNRFSPSQLNSQPIFCISRAGRKRFQNA